jgi:hypothetical protein
METHSDFKDDLRGFILILAHFVPTHCCISCPEISTNILHWHIGTPGTAIMMGALFAAVYAVINRIRIKTDVIKRFKSSISIYTRLIDDRFCAWHGSDKDFEFSHQNSAVPTH